MSEARVSGKNAVRGRQRDNGRAHEMIGRRGCRALILTCYACDFAENRPCMARHPGGTVARAPAAGHAGNVDGTFRNGRANATVTVLPQLSGYLDTSRL